MKKLSVLAALMLACTSAHAGNSLSFEINGKKVRIEAPDHCDQLSCLKISAPGLSAADFGFKGSTFGNGLDDDVDAAPRTDAPGSKSTVASAGQAVPQIPDNPAGSAPPAATASPSPTSAATASNRAAASVAVQNTSAAPAPAPVATAPVQAATSPLGVWATEENKGMVRIEPCGQDLCGFAVTTGEKILINMKACDAKWTGRIHDPDSGRNYDSTIAMKGPNTLRVQGCAFGGLFCGGQTWSRVG